MLRPYGELAQHRVLEASKHMHTPLLVVCFIAVMAFFVLSVVIAVIWKHFEEKAPQDRHSFLIDGVIGLISALIIIRPLA